MIKFTYRGSTKKTEAFLKSVSKLDIMGILNSCGAEGVKALASATPVESGLASDSWSYKVSRQGSLYSISWNNNDVENGFPVAIMLQYGYGTGTGGFVQGQDYINPAMRPVFELIADKVWKAVTSAA